ncbi:MAG: fimbrial protein [Geobacteraceae bacterium GWC2_58_44]|nr:MAG: fimbrial protein [Geobacteraceae bacterium GWC2_58_44]HBG08060.1 fimbrial protein [Geobacter sp.]
MKFTTNLATRRYINMRRLNAGLVACFVLLGALLLFKVREVAYNHAELGRIRSLTAAAGNRPGAAKVSEAQLNALAGKIAFANTLIDKKSVNWLSLLDRLEEVVPNGVALTQIEPNQREQQLKINGVARSFANLRTFLENMEQSKNFSEVYLLGQSETKVGSTQQGLSFAVTCKVSYR